MHVVTTIFREDFLVIIVKRDTLRLGRNIGISFDNLLVGDTACGEVRGFLRGDDG